MGDIEVESVSPEEDDMIDELGMDKLIGDNVRPKTTQNCHHSDQAGGH
jgi:hypothetical protein